MGFPFLAPLKKETTDKLEAREKNKEALNTLMPFVILSSAAVVSNKIKPQDLKGIYASQNYDGFDYKGCVIANSTDIVKNYQLGKTIVGYDLDGKPIEVEGETNRRVSMPIIESVEIDTDGGNNTLKTASIKIRVFTLKQLEMFELFFLRPSMRVILEYGWNASIREKLDIQTHMFANKSHKEYIQKFSDIFSREEDAYRVAKGKYIDILKKTNFNYDFMAGVVSNFSFSPDADGTYSINLEISAGNELQLWMPVKQSKDSNQIAKKNGEPTDSEYQTWVRKLSADINNPNFKDLIFNNVNDWKDEFFNWGAVNITQKDTTFSKDAYISFKLILSLINKMKVYNEAPELVSTKPYFLDKERTKPIIPITSNSIIISPTIDFILPGKLPFIGLVKEPKKKDIIKLNPDPGLRQSCLINNREFNLSYEDKKDAQISIFDNTGAEIKIPATTGNLLNVYFRYETFIRVYNSAYTAADVINSLFDTINANMYGLCKLELQKENDGQDASPLIIVDRKLARVYPKESKEKIFRFKVGALNSIVKEFSFNMELSTLMQAQALYASQLAIGASQNITPKGSTAPEKDPYSHADLSYAKNSDNYFSVNAVEIQIVKSSERWNKKIEETANVTKEEPKPKDGEEEAANASEVLVKNFVKFKENPASKTSPIKSFIYTDAALIQAKIPKSDERTNTTALTYLDITLAIDGISGISCGEYFHIDGVPEIYNENGYFQVTNVKQGIDNNGWKTTIEAGYLIKAKEPEAQTK
jgi:hypothetical protein